MFLAGKQEIMALDGTGVSYYIETVIVISVRISIILNRRMAGLHTLLNLYVSKFLLFCGKYWLFLFLRENGPGLPRQTVLESGAFSFFIACKADAFRENKSCAATRQKERNP